MERSSPIFTSVPEWRTDPAGAAGSPAMTLDGGQKYTTAVPHNYEPIITNKLLKSQEAGQLANFDVKPARSSVLLSLPA